MLRTSTRALVAALLLALPAAAAAPPHAAATLLPGDRLHGVVAAPGDADSLSIYLPAGSILSVDLLADPGSALLPALEALDPDDVPLDLTPYSVPGPKGVGVKVRKALAGTPGGVFTFLAEGSGGTTGKYFLRLTAKMPTKTFGTLTVPAGQQAAFTFDAPAGSKLAWAVKLPAGALPNDISLGLEAPDTNLASLTGLSGRKHPLDQDGTWKLIASSDAGSDLTCSVVVTLTLPPASRRVLYLSPAGFGPAPKVKGVSPKKVLNDRPAPGVTITGTGFDPAAVVRLERTGQAPLEPTAFTVDSGMGTATADFDVTGLAAGGWKAVVENPSGGAGSAAFVIQAPGSVILPPGVRTETEAWWLDFDEPAFKADLAGMGLGSNSAGTAALAEGAVKSYVLYWLRVAFKLDPLTGLVTTGTSVPVSFCLDAPPYTVGAPGAGYDRLSVGGAAAGGDPSSNPNYAWGDGPLDTGNAAYEDLSPAFAAGYGVRTAALAPPGAGAYHDLLKPLLDVPLTAGDAQFFFPGFSPASAAEGQRYRDIAAVINVAGREIAGTLAHFVARSMGTADGASGLSSVPSAPGTYATMASFSFLGPELDALRAPGLARTGLPGKMKTLKANWFPYVEGSGYLLPDATSTKVYSYAFVIGGGRPDRVDGDLQFTGTGSLPAGIDFLATGAISGTAPLRNPDNTLDGGVFRFIARLKDKVSGETLFFTHRLNLLVDVANPGLAPAEVSLAQQMNTQTLNTP